MPDPGPELARGFLDRWRGDRAGVDRDALASLLLGCCARAREAWPDLALDGPAFAAWLADRVPEGADPLAALPSLRIGDLHLCCACLRGDHAAIRALEANFLARVPTYLASLRPAAELIDATRQELRDKLLVAGPDCRPKLAQYAGSGPLDGWLRVAAVRTALNLVQAEGRRAAKIAGPEPIDTFITPGTDLELDFIKARYRDDFLAALREALAALPARERNLLRFAFLDDLTPARIAAIYNVHRTTAMRWLQAAERDLLAGLRARLRARLRVSEAECDSLMTALRSRLSLTLSALIPPPP